MTTTFIILTVIFAIIATIAFILIGFFSYILIKEAVEQHQTNKRLERIRKELLQKKRDNLRKK